MGGALAPLRCAVIGTGGVAHLHAAALAAHAAAHVVAVTDLDRVRADEFAARWGIPGVYDNMEDLLRAARPQLVLICTPPAAHLSQARAAFAAGAHVLVEKPPAPTLEALDDMQSAARAANRSLAVVFQQRTGTAAAHVRELLRAGVLGRPLVATCHTLWFRDQTYFDVPWRGAWSTEGGGTTLGHGIHQLDLLAYLLGDWATVEARLWRADRETETEDLSTATIVFKSGVVASVVNSAVSPREVSAIRIDTQMATITVEHLSSHGHENWKISPAPGVPADRIASWSLPQGEVRSGHDALIHGVVDALLHGEELPPTASDPARSLELVAAVYASAAADGAPITPQGLAAHPTHRAGFVSPVCDLRPL